MPWRLGNISWSNGLMRAKVKCLASLVRDSDWELEAWPTDPTKDIKFNIEGAFFGKLDPDSSPESGKGFIIYDEDGPRKGALPYMHFLAVPLVRIDDQHPEERYVSTAGNGFEDSGLSELLNSFVHYAYQSSRGAYLFGDLQGTYT
jgi:hypothetical protein